MDKHGFYNISYTGKGIRMRMTRGNLQNRCTPLYWSQDIIGEGH